MFKMSTFGRATRVCATALAAFVMSQSHDSAAQIVGVNVDVDNAFNSALAGLASASSTWQATLRQLEQTLIQQGQAALANQVQSVLNRGIATASIEVRCSATFLATMAASLTDSLRAVWASFRGEPVVPPPPRFCSVDPSSVDLRVPVNQRMATMNFYGFNFSSSNLLLTVINEDGSRMVPPPGQFTVPTEYMATFNIVNYPFSAANRYIDVELGGGERHQVLIVQRPQCGDLGQACCAVGAPCGMNAGCYGGTCVTCPPPIIPQLGVNVESREDFCGNNLGGQHLERIYGRTCDIGYHRGQCDLNVLASCGRECTAVRRWASEDEHDCRCLVRFDTPNDLFKGIHVAIRITQDQDVPPMPTGCP